MPLQRSWAAVELNMVRYYISFNNLSITNDFKLLVSRGVGIVSFIKFWELYLRSYKEQLVELNRDNLQLQ